MESLSHPFHRRKLSNATGKNAYDGVFSGHHRQKFDGAVSPAVNVDEYREIFSSGEGVSSIPVLDLSNLDESTDCLSSKPDYGNIFGGFRDLDIAVSYEELVARDKIRDPSSTSQSSQDLGDESHQSSDALKQFNMSYNKIRQRSKNGLDGTTHVTQLHSVPGFTCFIDESASQPKKETVKQNSSITNNVHPSVNSSKRDFPEKQTSRSDAEARSKHHQDDKNIKTFQADLESHLSKVSSSPAVSQPKKETEKQKSAIRNNIHPPSLNSSKRDFDLPEKQTSLNDVESGSGYGQDESLSGDTNFKTFQSDLRHPSKVSSSPAASTTNDESAFQPKNETEKQNSLSKDINLKTFHADLKSHPSKVSLSPEASATNLDNHKDYQKRSPATNTETFKNYAPGGFPPTFFDEEVDVNSAAAVSAAVLRKAIEKAQESIRIAKESVGRKKEGLRGFSSKSFKDSLKVKTRVVNVSTGEEQKEKDDTMKASQVFSNGRSHDKNGGTVVFPDFADGERLFGAKKVINEIHRKISESAKKYEIPLMSSLELRDDKIVCKSKEEVIETEAVDPGSSGKSEYAIRFSESIENSTYEAPQEDNLRPNGFLVFETLEEKVEDTKEKINNENKDEVRPSDACKLDEGLNKLTVYEKVEDEKKIPEVSDQNGYEKRFSEVLGLLENKKQEVHEQEHDEKVVEDEIELKEEGDTNIDKEEDTSEKFYDVCEVETIENAQAYCLGTNEVSPKEDCEMKEKENHEPEETWKNLDTIQEPEIYENSSSDYDDAEESESVHSANHIVIDTHEIDDVSSSSEFQVEDTEEKEIFKDIYADQTISEDEDECEAKSDDLSNRGLADMDFGQNDARSESSSDTIHGMEIEIKEYKEREETIVSEDEEETNLQPSHEETETHEIGIKKETETGTSQEPKDEVVEKEQSKSVKEVTAEERERERIKLAVERAIREARERAFIEARERVERAAVERATAEVRQRVMADAQERVAKASDKTSAQSKLRAERAAVERATAEARQRALEKAMSQKKTSEPKIQVNEIKQMSSSVTHTSTESALRSKAKLEKHNRIMERAAKALAEKEKRDLLVLKEQAERSRLSENLDADIKRWSSGKEGNLRALLSTLQYILGAESGWQAVSLTEIITASAVKKAYRKATLCVHPDKLQQRGATIQQKYICEKVFDLLKVAWNRFNSEER